MPRSRAHIYGSHTLRSAESVACEDKCVSLAHRQGYRNGGERSVISAILRCCDAVKERTGGIFNSGTKVVDTFKGGCPKLIRPGVSLIGHLISCWGKGAQVVMTARNNMSPSAGSGQFVLIEPRELFARKLCRELKSSHLQQSQFQ